MMKTKTIDGFSLKADHQGLEHIDPRKRAFTDEPALVCLAIEMAFAPTFHRFSIPLVLCNVRNDPTIPEQLARRTGIKAAIRIEQGTFIRQAAALEVCEQIFQLLLKLIAIVMIARNDTSRRDNVALGIRYRQDVARFGMLSSLIGNRIAPFFAALWLPSRLSSDTCNSPRIVMILASKSRCMLPSRLHLRK
jgi:hypothetical protein